MKLREINFNFAGESDFGFSHGKNNFLSSLFLLINFTEFEIEGRELFCVKWKFPQNSIFFTSNIFHLFDKQ